MSDMERTANRAILKHAVMRKIYCDRTGQVLDTQTAVMVTATLGPRVGTSVFAGSVYDTFRDSLAAIAAKEGVVLEVLDGRELYGRRKPRA
jgi:hypothetical protein